MSVEAYVAALTSALLGAPAERYWSALDVFLERHVIRHFAARELVPVGRVAGSATLSPAPPYLWRNIVQTLHALEYVRAECGNRPVHVHSAWRDQAYNKAVGGSPDSQHKKFAAVDFSIEGVRPRATYDILVRLDTQKKLGLGLYDTFVHLDCRGWNGDPAPARWDERKARAA